MSIYANPMVNTIEIPFKIFVTGSNEVEAEKPTKEFVGQLNFCGDEAKNAYEEIIATEDNQKKKTKSPIKEEKEVTRKAVVNSNGNSMKNQTKMVSVNSIMKAVEQRDLAYLKTHIHAENVNNTDTYGWTPLMLAAYYGFVDIVDFLLKSGANKRFREKSGLTAAQLALKKNYLDIVALLRKNSHVPIDYSMKIQELSINKKEEKKLVEEQEKQVDSYCQLCKAKFKSKQHENSILHLFNTKSKLPSTIFGIPKANKGYQMLLSSGWDEDSGLGRDGKGQKYPVKTVLKVDRKGLGLATKVESRITHFKPGDTNAVKNMKTKMYQHKVPTKKDREKLLSRETRKERALRIALS